MIHENSKVMCLRLMTKRKIFEIVMYFTTSNKDNFGVFFITIRTSIAKLKLNTSSNKNVRTIALISILKIQFLKQMKNIIYVQQRPEIFF